MYDSEGDATLAGVSGDGSVPRGRGSTIEIGAVVGRYVVLQRIGAGGMGVVFAAYDPELDRKVALKLLLPGMGGDVGRARLLREAQALAKLSHPNVVGIHDVGTVGEQVWLAMEFVEGQTLRRWLQAPRRWTEVLAILRAAGEGLAAAHAAGLLHRDFKPDNVMVGNDGRVRVMDFGLARLDPTADSAESKPWSASLEASTASTNDVTVAGALVGTPSYMAPEQFARKGLTPATDQFAFCVTLWEALYGQHPFGEAMLAELAASVIEGRVRSPARGRAAPLWLRRACERGLSVDPAQRWPSMAALLETLARGRSRAAVRKGVAAVGVLVLLGAGVEAQRRWDLARRAASCEAAAVEIDAAWNDERRQAVRDGLLATRVSYAAATADKVTPWLERQAQQWREARVEACLDAEVRGQWDAETLDRSLWCLEDRRVELESLVDELIVADADVLETAVMAAAALDPVTPCRDRETLHALAPPPQEAREALRAARADVARSKGLERAGRYDKGIALARGALERAEALEWTPLVAAARVQLGGLLEKSGAYAEAEAELERAYFDASKGVAPEVVLAAATTLVQVVGVKAARYAEGRHWARLADVALFEVPDPGNLRQMRLLSALATVHRKAGDYDEAKQLCERALAITRETLGPEHPFIASRLHALAASEHDMGNFAGAEAIYEQALAIKERALGEHPDVAATLGNLADVHRTQGEYAEAKQLLERARAISEKTQGPRHPEVGNWMHNLANIHSSLGEYDEARTLYERTMALWEATLGPEHPHMATVLNNLAIVHEATGNYDEAVVLLERALAISLKTVGPEHPDVGGSLNTLAIARAATGAHAEAEDLFERALANWEATLGPEHPDVAYPLSGLADVMIAQQRPGDAIAPAERANELREHGGVPAELLAETRFILARALWEAPLDAGRDRARAAMLAGQVRDAYRSVGKRRTEDLAEVEQWLAEHPQG